MARYTIKKIIGKRHEEGVNILITIEITEESLENEPAPNFYWRGTPSDYLKLVHDLHRLGSEANAEVCLNEKEYIQVLGEYRVIAKSSKQGNVLCRVTEKAVVIDLANHLWRQILVNLFILSFYPCHNYIEFDDQDLIEDANFIVSSEA